MPLYLNGKKVDNIDQAIISEDGWIGIGAALERIVFDGSGNDISVLGANLGVGVSDPGYTTEIGAVAGSDATFALSDGDIAHGMTTLAQTDVFAHAGPISSTVGGVRITGLTDADGQALEIRGVIGATDPTDTTPAVKIIGAKKNGTGIQDLAAAETVWQVANNDDAAAITVLGNGNVGIRTTNPGAILDIQVDATTPITLFRVLDTQASDASFTIEGWGDTNWKYGNQKFTEIYWDGSTDGYLKLYDAGTEKIRLHSTGNSFINSGNVGIGTTGPLDPLTVLATSIVGSETLTETAFTTHANWDVTGDFLDTGGNAAYTHATGVGTLTQQSANFAIPVKPGRYYKFAYTVSGVTAGCTANITTAVASATTALTLNNGAQTTYFKSAAAPGNFVISATSTAGAFTLDNVTLKEVQGGAGNFGGGLTALTGTFEASDNGTAITARINAAQASVDAGDTFIDFRSTTGSEGTIAGTAVAGVLAYNTFTGSHYTQVVDRVGLEIGMVLEIVDGTPVFEPQLNEAEHTIQVDEPVLDDEGNPVIEDVPVLDDEGKPKTESKSKTKKVEQVVPATYYVASPKPQLWKSQICKTQGSKAAIGVWIGTDREGRDMVASIGTGVIWLANTGKSLTVGDYLVSSDIAGCAELQTDDIYRSSTIAKLVEGIVWQPGEVTRLVKCIYLGG